MSSKKSSLKVSGGASAAEDEGQDAWVFDSLVGFLRGPVWNVPILTFIEHKSLIFEPDTDENEEEYKKIHDDYKNLVDYMLGSYMQDIGITASQFQDACGVASEKIKTQFHHALFEQVWAADDFEIFKRMMIQKNIELQLQALELLQQRYGVLPSSLQPGESTKDKKGKKKKAERQSESEDKVMEAVLKKSLAEHKDRVKALDKDKKTMEESVAKSKNEQQRLEAQRDQQQILLAEHFKNKVSISNPSAVSTDDDDEVEFSLQSHRAEESEKLQDVPVLPPLVLEKTLSAREAILSSDEAKALEDHDEVFRESETVLGEPSSSGAGVDAPPSGAEIDAEELARRTNFLKAQRDRLLAMKKEERDKQLAEAEKQQMKSRPKSARAARSAFGRSGRAGASSGIDPDVLKVRRALAEKLKQEVIGKN